MYAKLYSGGILGIEGYRISIEVNVSGGMPRFEVVGLPDQAVNEARERVVAAVTNTGGSFPARRVIINLAPASMRKTGSFYDAAFALGVMIATNQTDPRIDLSHTAIFGELALNGNLRPVRGLFPMLLTLHEQGITSAIVPVDNAKEAEIVEGLTVYPVKNLAEAIDVAEGRVAGSTASGGTFHAATPNYPFDFHDVRGQESVKRAAKIVAAGGHNFMMIGPPGCGKTLIARRLLTILPNITHKEALEVTKVYSIVGLIPPGKSIIAERPFRSPHHTASYASIAGGGQFPRPGEVTLAHNGILFLDEFGEFDPKVLQTLREPMEERAVSISRASGTLKFPSNFILAAASNPCDCGYLGDTMKACTCTEASIRRYRSRLSGPVMDRIDIIVDVRRVPYDTLKNAADGETSAVIRSAVQEARDIQTARFRGTSVYCNAMMGPREIAAHCKLDTEGETLMRAAVNRIGITARSYDKILRIARTIADCAGAADICAEHISEAIQYRGIDRMMA
ncbi:MAG: YifB family Mg chelatase-like AAA ATPase [Spirochaetes bacterium]|nr:YifB family Mg chelatase-like AAA ATPase [Spirochaetota bacterium]